MVGLVPDITKICGQSWTTEGDIIYLLGSSPSSPQLGASEYLAVIHNMIAGKPPEINELEKLVQAACRHGISQGWINSAHDCAEGGLATSLAESCIGNDLGAKIALSISDLERLDEVLFGEAGNRIVVSVNPEHVTAWETYLQQSLSELWQKLGTVTSQDSGLEIITVDNLTLINVKIDDMKNIWYRAIQNRLAGA